MTIEQQIAALITSVIYHGRHFAPSRDAVVIKKDVEYILSLLQPVESSLRVNGRPLTPAELVEGYERAVGLLTTPRKRPIRNDEIAEALTIKAGSVTLEKGGGE
jgi:hypothetical protein